MVEFVFYIINSFVFILLRRRRRHRRYCCHRCCCRRRHRCGCRCHQRCRRHRRRHHHHHRRRLRRRRHIITPHSPVGLVADADCKHDDAVIPGYLRCLLRHYWVLRLAVRDDDGDARTPGLARLDESISLCILSMASCVLVPPRCCSTPSRACLI